MKKILNNFIFVVVLVIIFVPMVVIYSIAEGWGESIARYTDRYIKYIE